MFLNRNYILENKISENRAQVHKEFYPTRDPNQFENFYRRENEIEREFKENNQFFDNDNSKQKHIEFYFENIPINEKELINYFDIIYQNTKNSPFENFVNSDLFNNFSSFEVDNFKKQEKKEEKINENENNKYDEFKENIEDEKPSKKLKSIKNSKLNSGKLLKMISKLEFFETYNIFEDFAKEEQKFSSAFQTQQSSDKKKSNKKDLVKSDFFGNAEYKEETPKKKQQKINLYGSDDEEEEKTFCSHTKSNNQSKAKNIIEKSSDYKSKSYKKDHNASSEHSEERNENFFKLDRDQEDNTILNQTIVKEIEETNFILVKSALDTRYCHSRSSSEKKNELKMKINLNEIDLVPSRKSDSEESDEEKKESIISAPKSTIQKPIENLSAFNEVNISKYEDSLLILKEKYLNQKP